LKQRFAAVLVALALIGASFGVARWAASPKRAQIHNRAGARGKAKLRRAKSKKSKSKRKRKSRGAKSKSKHKLSAAEATAPIVAGPKLEAVVGDTPNVVLIIGCTVRADQVTPYGGHREVTPYLARQVEEGVIFEGGISSAPWTKAASAAILTGYEPASIGMVEPLDRPSRRVLPAEVDTLAELFSRAGYQTFGATANPNLNEVFGFGQGFDAYVEGTDLWRLGGRAKVHGRSLVNKAIPMLAGVRKPEQPTYLQFLFTDAHSPSTVQRVEIERVRDGSPPKVATYRAMLRRFDMAVALLERSLEHQGITRENTVFIVVSDHGEGLNHPSFNGLGHGNFTYPSAVRMPWLMWGQGVAEGHRVGGMASQIDILPTLTDLLGVEGYEGPGRSWAAAVRGETDRTDRELAFVDSWFQASRRSGVYAEDLHCHDDWKAVVDAQGERRVPRACYDQDDTPLTVSGERADALLAELDSFRLSMESAFDAYPYTSDAEAPDDVKAELEALGYVEGQEGVVP